MSQGTVYLDDLLVGVHNKGFSTPHWNDVAREFGVPQRYAGGYLIAGESSFGKQVLGFMNVMYREDGMVTGGSYSTDPVFVAEMLGVYEEDANEPRMAMLPQPGEAQPVLFIQYNDTHIRDEHGYWLGMVEFLLEGYGLREISLDTL